MKLSDADWQLSMHTSRRRREGEPEGLRSLLVHRLRRSAKAVMRMRLSNNLATSRDYGVRCEPCKKWVNTEGAGEEFRCPHCGGLYILEYAVFSRVETGTEEQP